MEPKIDRYITVVVYNDAMHRQDIEPVTMPADQLDDFIADLPEGWSIEPL